MRNQSSGYALQDISRLSKWLRGLLVLDIALSVVAIVSGLWERQILARIVAFTEGSAGDAEYKQIVADAEQSDFIQLFVGPSQIAIFLVTAIVFLRWMYVASRNCHAVSKMQLAISPGWAVGWFFIPIANLWKPYQAMRQISNVSIDPIGDPARPGSNLLFVWWLLFLVSGTIGRTAFKQAMKADDLSELQDSNLLTLFSDSINIPATLLAFLVIGTITSLQAVNFLITPNGSNEPLAVGKGDASPTDDGISAYDRNQNS